MEPLRDQGTARVFLAIPLYCSADKKIFEYFSNDEYRNELDAITATDLLVLIPREMQQRGNFVVYDKVRESGRFQMDVADLPCIYLEDDGGGWVAIKLKDDVGELRAVFKALSSAARNGGPQGTASSL